MSHKDQHLDLDRLVDFLLLYASIQKSVGVQTSRIIRNTIRIAHSFGCDVTVMMFQRNVSISLKQNINEHKARHMTALNRHTPKPLNFYLNAHLNQLSWFAYEHHPSLDVLENKLSELMQKKPLNRWFTLGMISIATAAFCKIFGGDYWAAGYVLLSTLLGFYIKQELGRMHTFIYAITIVSSFVSSFIVGLLYLFTHLSHTPNIALLTSILYLVPGVPFINSMIDFFDNYILNGVSRLINAILILVSMTLGITVTLILLNLSLL